MLELEHGFRVVDVHARRTPTGRVGGGGRSISADRLEREMHQAGIVRAVVTPDANSEMSYVGPNNEIARFCADRPFIPFARINGTRRVGDAPTTRLRNAVSREKEWHTSPSDVEKYGYDDRFHGFVLDPTIDDYPDEPVLEMLESVGLPLLVRGDRTAPPADLAEALLVRSIPVVVAHFGGYPLDRERATEMLDLLDRYDDCYVETSLVRYRDLLERALLEHPGQVLFGSGAPACHPDVAVMEILTLDLSEDKLWRVFSKNATRVVDGLAPEVV